LSMLRSVISWSKRNGNGYQLRFAPPSIGRDTCHAAEAARSVTRISSIRVGQLFQRSFKMTLRGIN
jgi:hypothetical protein